MNVIFLTHNYPRFPGDLPGSFLHPLARALLDRRHDVRVVAPSDQGRGGREPVDGVPVRRVRYAAPHRETLAYTGRMQEAIRSPSGLAALVSLIRALRQGVRAELAEFSRSAGSPVPPPAIVHAHWWFPSGLAAPPEVARVVTLHGTDGRILARSGLARWAGRRVLRSAEVVTAVSPELAGLAEAVSGRDDIMGKVIPMPVDSSNFPWSGGGGGVLVVARLTAQKRVELAIEATRILAARGQPVNLTIIGDGPERARLERMGSPAVRFAGAQPRAGVIAALAIADVMVFPAREEGLGLAALEALMCGVPVVACTDGGGVVSALSRHGGGIMVEPGAEAMAAGIEEAWHRPAREAARAAGEIWRERLAPENLANAFEIWYGEALAR